MCSEKHKHKHIQTMKLESHTINITLSFSDAVGAREINLDLTCTNLEERVFSSIQVLIFHAPNLAAVTLSAVRNVSHRIARHGTKNISGPIRSARNDSGTASRCSVCTWDTSERLKRS